MDLRARRIAAAAVAVCLALAACSGDEGPVTAHPVRVEGDEFSFSAPGAIRGGLTALAFANVGSQVHQLQLLRLRGGKTAEQAAADLRRAETPAIQDWAIAGGGTQEVRAKATQTVTLNLDPGAYLFACFVGDHFRRGMWKGVQVGEGRKGALPASDGTIVAREYTFEVPRLRAGTRTLTARNEGPEQPHVFSLVEYPAGVTVEEVNSILSTYFAGKEPKDPPEPKAIQGFATIDPGGEGTFDTTFRAGRTYVLVCYIADRGGGRPHLLRGMGKVFTVP